MKKYLNYLPGIFLLLGILSSCIKKQDFSTVPKIEFKDFVKYGTDSAVFICTFQDGDGDIGLTQSDTSGNFVKTGPYFYNMVLTYYYKKTNGTFSTYVIGSGPQTGTIFQYQYRIPNITPDGQNKAIKGEIKVTMKPGPYYVDTHLLKIFRYEAYIYDRALNKSNVIVTPDIPIP